MKAELHRGESHRSHSSTGSPQLRVGSIRTRTRIRWSFFLLYIVCAIALVHFVSGSLGTPVRDEFAWFLLFVSTGTLIVRRIRSRRRAGRRAHAKWVGERSGCSA